MNKIENFDGYEVTEDGEVFSTRRGKVKQLKKHKEAHGYYRVQLRDNQGKPKSWLVHRLVALVYLDNPNDYEYVNHKDGNKLNNHVSNLEWCTASQNQHHAYKTGLKSSKGEKNSQNILSEAQVKEIYGLLLDGRRVKDLADQYRVHPSCISDIKAKRNWCNLLEDYPPVTIKSKRESFSDATVHWICKQLENKISVPCIVSMAKNSNITEHRVYDIKRKRGYLSISSQYNF